jgi:hypothetical protein
MVPRLNVCVGLYRHGSVVAGFGIMNTTFIRVVLCVCREDPWHIFMCVAHGRYLEWR